MAKLVASRSTVRLGVLFLFVLLGSSCIHHVPVHFTTTPSQPPNLPAAGQDVDHAWQTFGAVTLAGSTYPDGFKEIRLYLGSFFYFDRWHFRRGTYPRWHIRIVASDAGTTGQILNYWENRYVTWHEPGLADVRRHCRLPIHVSPRAIVCEALPAQEIDWQDVLEELEEHDVFTPVSKWTHNCLDGESLYVQILADGDARSYDASNPDCTDALDSERASRMIEIFRKVILRAFPELPPHII